MGSGRTLPLSTPLFIPYIRDGWASSRILNLNSNLNLNRLFPHIIQKLDGHTLLQKIDARTLAAKVLPYLDLSASVRLRSGTAGILNVQDIARDLGLTFLFI